MANKQHHEVFIKNNLSFDRKEGIYKESYVRLSLETFFDYGFNRMLTKSELSLYLAIYSEIDKKTNIVQRSPKYWMDKVGIKESTLKKARPKLQELGLIRAKHHNPKKKKDGSNQFDFREYDEYSILSFDDALRLQVKKGIRPTEDLKLLGNMYIEIVENIVDEVKEEVATSKEEDKKEDIENKKEEKEVRNHRNEPSQAEMEAYYRQKEQKIRESKISTAKKGKNLLKSDALYFHPVLTGMDVAPTMKQDKDTGEFFNVCSDSEDNKPTHYSIEDAINYFYKEFNIPSAKMSMKRDIAAMRRLWPNMYEPVANTAGVETLDLLMFTITTAKSSSYDSDNSVDDLFQLQNYIDEAVVIMGNKKTDYALSKEEEPEKEIKKTDIKTDRIKEIVSKYYRKLDYSELIVAGYLSEVPNLDINHLEEVLSRCEKFNTSRYIQAVSGNELD